jgi:enterobactin synthetase component D / holo-[acyl-carrier protein] synthase
MDPDFSHAPAPPVWPSPFPPDVAFRQAGPGDAAGMALLPGERALLSARVTARRLAEFTLGRGCARAALAALAPERAAELAATPILREDARRPRWPAGFVGSITHHRGLAAAAAARAADYEGLGLDLESVRKPSPELVRRILRPEERAAWQELPPQEWDAAFMRWFSAKESLFKALYPLTGVYLGFQEAAVEEQEAELESEAQEDVPGGVARAILRWRLHKACGPDFPVGRAGPGCVLSQGGAVLSGVWLRRED